DEHTASSIASIMMRSREAVVDYMTPLGLCQLMARDHHYGPGPWVEGGRPDWTSVYFHRADALGIGFDRGPSGSDAVSQYAPPLRDFFADPGTCPERYLLFFHRVSWDRRLGNGGELWDELCLAYQRGLDAVRGMRKDWTALEGRVDPFRHDRVAALLAIQEREAAWWKDACLSYFASLSGRPYPAGVEPPARELGFYRSIVSRNVPGLGRIG
ncbi:MAG: hypothetical protein Q8M76_10265, partial [Spirochaetaceae bacterium]|nr:hypothetical protein [Spirochaetaceae bacterium]